MTNIKRVTKESSKKDPIRQEHVTKTHEAYMERLREDILRDNQLFTPYSTGSTTPSTVSSTCSCTCSSTPSMGSSTARFSDTYIYGAGIVAVLAISVCVLFAYTNKSSQAANKEQQQPIKPKRRSMLRYHGQKTIRKHRRLY